MGQDLPQHEGWRNASSRRVDDRKSLTRDLKGAGGDDRAETAGPFVSTTVWARGGKRVFDVLVTVLALIILSPGLVIAGLLVKLSSRGPLLFGQVRAGKDAAPFRVVKFRTMRGGRKPDPKELVPLDHPEITRVGRVLRRFKIDELPQLIHVLGGQMSLVGPRPTLPDQAAAYDGFRRRRLLVRPGITGLAQVYGHSMMSWDERILYDIAYVRKCSAALDMHILCRTILVVVLGERRMSRPFQQTRFARFVEPPEGYAGHTDAVGGARKPL